MKATTEQQAILDHCATSSANLMINALAGTGKSATLKLIDQASKVHPSLYLVFAKRNATEATASQAFRSTTTIRTFNACGHRIWASKVGSIRLDPRKSRTLWNEHLDGLSKPAAREAWKHYSVVMDGLEKAKSLGYIPSTCTHLADRPALITRHDLYLAMDERPIDHAARLIDTLLVDSIRLAFEGTIDFNDQIYMPALFGGTFPRFPRVMVDEYQDQSPVNHAMLARLVTSRLIGVGDPFQNIYGFRGAKAGGMASAVTSYSMTELPLSTSFRCPQAIVEAARWRVPHFNWLKEGGNVTTVDTFHGTSFPDDSTIICRNNAPLLRLAFRLISNGRSVSVAGSELGPRLVSIMKKLGDPELFGAALSSAIEDWREARLLAGSKSAEDTADCMHVLADHGGSLGAAISYAEHIFAQHGSIALLTGHKSKGLEFSNVFWLDPDLCRPTEQDNNLRYVITTRSQNKLTILNSADIRW